MRDVGHSVASFVGVAALAAAGVAGGAQVGGFEVALRIAGVLAVLALGAAARLSVVSGGLATADFLLRTEGVLTDAERERRAAAARARLVGGVLALSLVAAGAGAWLAFTGAGYDPLLAVLLGVCLVTRSRLFARTAGASAAFVLGAVAIAVGMVHLVLAVPMVPARMWVVLGLAAGVSTVLAMLPARPRGQSVAARSQQAGVAWPALLQWAESTAVLALVCVAFAALVPWVALAHRA
jgi:hypothetical protein